MSSLGKRSPASKGKPGKQVKIALTVLLVVASLFGGSILAVRYMAAAQDDRQPAGEYLPSEPVAAALLWGDEDMGYPKTATFQQALAQAGIASDWQGQPEPDRADLEAAVATLSQQTGLDPGRIWMMATPTASQALFELSRDLEVAGQIWILPPPAVTDAMMSAAVHEVQWPLRIVATDLPAQSARMRELFQTLSGEDAELFGPARPQGPGRAVQHVSADGRIVLSLHPHLHASTWFHDASLVADLAIEIGAHAVTDDRPLASFGARAATFSTGQLRLAVLGYLFLAATPFFVPVALFSRRKKLRPLSISDFFMPVVSWILAAFLLAAAAIVHRYLGGLPSHEVAGLIFLLPGGYGLFSGLWVLAQKSRPKEGDDRQDEGLKKAGCRMPEMILLSGAIAAQFFLFWLWRHALHGWQGLSLASIVIAFLLFVWNLPGTFARPGSRQSPWPAKALLLGLRHAPWALLLLAVLLRQGWPALLGAAWFVVLLSLADRNGKLLALASGRPWLGRMVRALFLASVWLHPGVTGLLLD